VKSIPELNQRDGSWVRSKLAAQMESVTVDTLSNYRTSGTKDASHTCGIDEHGRQWRKPRPNAHVWYLRDSLRPAQPK